MAPHNALLSVLLGCLVASIAPAEAHVEASTEVDDWSEVMGVATPQEQLTGDLMPARFALSCKMVGGKGKNVTVLSDYKDGGLLKTVNVIAGPSAIRVMRAVLTSGESMVFGDVSAAKARKTVSASFTFWPGERVTKLRLWTNGRNGEHRALGAIEFTTDAGRRFEVGTTNRTHRPRADPTTVEGRALGAGLITAVKAVSDARIVGLCFQFLRPVTGVKLVVDRYPWLERVTPRGVRNVLGDGVYENPTDSAQNVGFSGAPRRTIEHSWNTSLGLYFNVDIKTVSAPAPVLGRTNGKAIQWRLDGRQDWPLQYVGEDRPSYNYSVSVPAGSRVYSKVVMTKYDLRTEYEGRAILETGEKRSWRFGLKGEYAGKMFELGERIGDED